YPVRCGKWRSGLPGLDRCALMMRCAGIRRQWGYPLELQCLSPISFGAYTNRIRTFSFETLKKLSTPYSTKLSLRWRVVNVSSCAALGRFLLKFVNHELAATPGRALQSLFQEK